MEDFTYTKKLHMCDVSVVAAPQFMWATWLPLLGSVSVDVPDGDRYVTVGQIQ